MKKSRRGMFKHINDNQGLEIDWENLIVIDRDANVFRRRSKEVLYIRANADGTLMNPNKGTPINYFWSEFNIFMREM